MLHAVVFAYLAVPGVLKMGFSLNRKCISSNRVDLICRFVAGPWDAGSRNRAGLGLVQLGVRGSTQVLRKDL